MQGVPLITANQWIRIMKTCTLFRTVMLTGIILYTNPALSQSTQSGILDYFELARANAAAPKGKSFLPQGIAPWDVFRMFGPLDANAFGFGRKSATGLRFPWLGLGAIGSLLGNVVSAFIDRITSFTFLNPRLPGQLSASRRAAAIPTPIREDMPLFVALVVVVVIVLLYVFPSPFNI